MELVLQQLLHVIEQMTGHSRRLAELAQRQRAAIIQEQIREIGEIVIDQENEMAAFHRLDQERESLLAELCAQLEIDPAGLNFARLLERVPAVWSHRYRSGVEALRQQAAVVKQEHEANRRLLQRSRQFISWLLNYLVTPEGAAPVYDQNGEHVQSAYYHIVNQRW